MIRRPAHGLRAGGWSLVVGPQTDARQEFPIMWPASSSNRPTLSESISRRRLSPRTRLSLERLEDRTVPASLSYSTFLHGTVYATAVDDAGDIYVTGSTDSTLQTTPGAFQTSGSGGAFVAKLNPTGTAVIYATYLGNGGDGGTGIAVDAAGDAYVISEGGTVPTTANAIASLPDSNATDFVAELNPTGSGLNYATYLPGTADGTYLTFSLAGAIALDGSGNIYVAGAAEPGLPVTASAFQAAPIGTGATAGNSTPFFMKINPALSGAASVVYASYLGGSSGSDAATGIAVDGAGNAYLEGYTWSSDFPTTTGAFQRSGAGRGQGVCAFVAKFDPALSGAASLVYSTYLGGTTTASHVTINGSGYEPNENGLVVAEIAGGIAVDSEGNAYVTSGTTSTNFPTTPGAYQTTSNLYAPKSTPNSPYVFESDVFVTKLNPTGSALVYSTYLGGGMNVISSGGKHGITSVSGTRSGGASIAVDTNGDAHITRWTNSTTFPSTNALQTTNAGGYDAFVTVLNPTGSGLLFSSYFGGGGTDYGYGIALDSAGNAYVGGQTASSNFPTTPGAYQTAPGQGFALKIDPPADTGEVSVPIPAGGTIGTAGGASPNVANDLRAEPSLPASPLMDFFTVRPATGTGDAILGYSTRNDAGTGRFLADAFDRYGVFSDPIGLDLLVQ
jgi:hypothetical protein